MPEARNISMKLIVGLGNPGFRYRNTRHNMGFLVIKLLSKQLNVSVRKRRYNGLYGYGSVGSKRISLFMPQTYMNLSGEAVRGIVIKEGIELEDILIICDDINIIFGSLRLRRKGTAGGHKGLISIIEGLETNEFARLRVGVGKDHEITNVVRFVLNPFDRKERTRLDSVIERTSECAKTWATEGSEKAMTLYNQ